jgi:hypothetical protein
VLARDATSAVIGLLEAYQKERDAGESLQSWLRRQPDEVLATASRPAR